MNTLANPPGCFKQGRRWLRGDGGGTSRALVPNSFLWQLSVKGEGNQGRPLTSAAAAGCRVCVLAVKFEKLKLVIADALATVTNCQYEMLGVRSDLNFQCIRLYDRGYKI